VRCQDAEKIKQTDGFPWKGNCDYVRAIVHINEYMKTFFFDVFEDVTQAYGVKVSVFLGYVCVTNLDTFITWWLPRLVRNLIDKPCV
jgi:hypothetical protein